MATGRKTGGVPPPPVFFYLTAFRFTHILFSQKRGTVQMKTFKEFFADAQKFVSTTYNGDEIMPTWIAENSEGIAIYATPWRSDQEKRETTQFLRQRFKDEGVFRYAMISESWMVSATNNKNPYDEVESLEDHPNRKEIVMIFAEEAQEKMMGHFEIIREGDNAHLADFQLMSRLEHIKGDMTGLTEGAERRH
jgi:hypothetical protein